MIDRVRDFLICPEEHREGFALETAKINLSRLKAITRLIPFLSVAAALFLLSYLNAHGYQPTPHAAGMHVANAAVNVFFFRLILWVERDEERVRRYGDLLARLYVVFVVSLVVAFSLVAQLTNGQMTVFVIGIIGVAIVAFQDPRFMAALYLAAGAAFVALLPLTQRSPLLRASHSINATFLAFTAWLLAAILFHGRITDHVQRVVIRDQFEDLTLLNSRLERLSTCDGLTGVSNRRKLDEAIAAEWDRAFRHRSPLSLAMLDLDAFKPYNDLYGHLAGDECLRELVRMASRHLKRPGDQPFQGVSFCLAANGQLRREVCRDTRSSPASASWDHGNSSYILPSPRSLRS